MIKETHQGYALVTGASSGMGYEFVQQLAAIGMNIIAVSNQKEALEKLSEEISETHKVLVLPVFMDLARADAAEELYTYCTQKGLQVQILINNAGFFFYKDAVDIEPEKAAQIMQLHMVTPSMLCTYFGKEMRSRKSGYILNMSSLSAHTPYPGLSYYASTKRYLKSYSRALRSELIDDHVSVTCVCPGAVATNLFDQNRFDHEKAMRSGMMMTAEHVVRLSLKALFSKKAVVVPGRINKILTLLVKITPHGLILFLKRKKLVNIQDSFVPMIIALLSVGIV